MFVFAVALFPRHVFGGFGVTLIHFNGAMMRLTALAPTNNSLSLLQIVFQMDELERISS